MQPLPSTVKAEARGSKELGETLPLPSTRKRFGDGSSRSRKGKPVCSLVTEEEWGYPRIFDWT